MQTVAQIEKIEMPTVVTRAVATQTTAASKRAGYAVAILLGLIVGVLLALISYAAWPAGRRDAAECRGRRANPPLGADFSLWRGLLAPHALVSVGNAPSTGTARSRRWPGERKPRGDGS